jgi:deoxyguanosine kinase
MACLASAPRFVAIEGPIRAGKSTLAALLAEQMGARQIVEPENNPFLAPFYCGAKGAAFSAQMWFLTARYRQMQQAMERSRASGQPAPLVSDYIFEKDKLFASLNLCDRELAWYDRQYRAFRKQLPGPDLVIYLQASAQVLRTRMKRKGIPGEQSIADEYVEQVVQAYEHFFFHYTASDLLVVNTDEIDFVRSQEDLQGLLRRFRQPVSGRQYFQPLSQRGRGVPLNLQAVGARGVSAVRRAMQGFGPAGIQATSWLRRAL